MLNEKAINTIRFKLNEWIKRYKAKPIDYNCTSIDCESQHIGYIACLKVIKANLLIIKVKPKFIKVNLKSIK